MKLIDDDVLRERARIWWETDTRTCDQCEAEMPETAIANPDWYLDTVLVPNEHCHGDFFAISVIRCPNCW